MLTTIKFVDNIYLYTEYIYLFNRMIKLKFAISRKNLDEVIKNEYVFKKYTLINLIIILITTNFLIFIKQ